MKVSEIPFWRTFFSRDDSNCIFIFSTVNPPYSIAGRTEWPKGIKSHQVFHEPDLEQLAQINFFVEDFGLRGRLLFFVVVAFVFLLVTLLLLLLSVSRLNSFLESLIDVSFFFFFFKWFLVLKGEDVSRTHHLCFSVPSFLVHALVYFEPSDISHTVKQFKSWLNCAWLSDIIIWHDPQYCGLQPSSWVDYSEHPEKTDHFFYWSVCSASCQCSALPCLSFPL